MFREYADGIDNEAGSPIVIHQLRHTFGSERAGNVDPFVLRDLMGYADIRTTLTYSRVNPERTRKAFQEFDRRVLR